MILEYAKVREDAMTPTRANPSDAGLDVYYSPKISIGQGCSLIPAKAR